MSLARYVAVVTLSSAVLSSSGCSQFIDPDVPEPIRPLTEPEFGTDYLLYRPSGYERRFARPLIVVCHGAFPDSPNKCIRAWTTQAEQHGFIVVAPTLTGAKARWGGKPDVQLQRQRVDERNILSVIRHVRAGHNISVDRIFLHGWSAGAQSVLHTGLRNPDLFRALALSQPKFKEGFLAETTDAIDHYQRVLINYSVADALWGNQARDCAQWLRSHGVDLTEDTSGDVTQSDTDKPVAFFQNVIRTSPWFRIRTLPVAGASALNVRFGLRGAPAGARFRWAFGDDTTALTADPVHEYAAPGVYAVAVTVATPDGLEHRRRISLQVPEGIARRSEDTPPQR